MKVFVITASSGQYSDTHYWVDCVYESKVKAEKYVADRMADIEIRKATHLTDEEEAEFQTLLNLKDGVSSKTRKRYNFLSDKRYDDAAHDFNGYNIREFELE